MTAAVFALSIDAEAANGCEYPAGERHHLIVLVPAASPEEAAAGAMAALSDCRWCRGEVREIGRLSVPLESLDDPILREAAGKALAGSRAIVVFSRR
ncbi:MAG TPA: hypothetical protein VFZ91_07395 [Allosphingosinicella sp.]